MPAHFSHLLFAEDALREATPAAELILERAGNLFRFGAQGPDIFYHNQRTRPLALRYGSQIHRRGFGTVVAHMADTARRTARRVGRPDMEQVAYLLGFATHAELDRHTHPYIICRAGWVRQRDPATQTYRRCHAFLERMLDVVALRALRSQELHQFDFFSGIYCGENLPYSSLKMLVQAINAAYPNAHYKSRNRRRMENAYADSIRFYTLTDHRNPQLRQRALERDHTEGYRQRRVAVFHFPAAGRDLDPANLHRRSWPHPCAPEVLSEASYLDLMAAAHVALVPRLRRLAALLELRPAEPAAAPGQGAAPAPAAGDAEVFAELAALFGNQSLGATLHGSTCTPIHAAPLPLTDVFERLYRAAATTFR